MSHIFSCTERYITALELLRERDEYLLRIQDAAELLDDGKALSVHEILILMEELKDLLDHQGEVVFQI